MQEVLAMSSFINSLEIVYYWEELIPVMRDSYEHALKSCEDYNNKHDHHKLAVFEEVYNGEVNWVLYDTEQYKECKTGEPFLHFCGSGKEPVHLPIGIKCLFMTFAHLGKDLNFSQLTEQEVQSVECLKYTWGGVVITELDLSHVVFPNVTIAYEAFADTFLMRSLAFPVLPNVGVLYKSCKNSQALEYVDMSGLSYRSLSFGMIDKPFEKCGKLRVLYCSKETMDKEVKELLVEDTAIEFIWEKPTLSGWGIDFVAGG